MSFRGGWPAPSATHSGGEAQRAKLAPEPSNRETCRTLYILNEPATGQHCEDVYLLLGVLRRLVDPENNVDVIEHTLHELKTSAWMVYLRPGGGVRGGTIVRAGTLEERAAEAESHAGRVLERVL